MWALFLLLQMALGFALGYGWNWKKLGMVVNNPVMFHHLFMAYQCMDYAAIALVTLLLLAGAAIGGEPQVDVRTCLCHLLLGA